MKTTLRSRLTTGTTALIAQLGNHGFLLLGILATNVLNFLFNAFAGRTLAPTDYGFLALINTFWIILLVSSSALTQVVSYQVARADGKHVGGWAEYRNARRLTLVGATALAAAWVLASPLIAAYFRATDVLGVATFGPMLWFGLMMSGDRGLIQ